MEAWRTITYAQTLRKVRRIGAACSRAISPPSARSSSSRQRSRARAARPCGELRRHPYAPVSPAYSLISSDFGKLRHIVNLLTPGLVFACNAQYARAIERACRRHEVIVGSLDQLDRRAEPPTRRMRASRPTRSRNSCSPPAPPACRKA
jgi:feruloyl-CoA synthase